MSETKALIFLFIGMMMLSGIADVVLLAMAHASGAVFGLAVGLEAALGGWLAGGIVVRYSEIDERKKREELILSR